MAATEACAAPVQEDGATETKTEVAETSTPVTETVNNEVVNKETVSNEVVNKDEAASIETDATPAAADAESAAPAEEAAATEQPAESKAKQAHVGIFDSFLNKSGLGKVMGGKKKKESSAGTEDAPTEEGKTNGEEAPGEEGAAKETEDQAIEKAPEGEEAEGKKEEKEAKPKQSEKSSVMDAIRKPVARIFSHKSTEKKDGDKAAEPQKQVTVRSKSLDRLEDPEALAAAAAEPAEEAPAADGEAQKPSSAATTKHMKRWHSFKKLMAQRSHKKSSDDPKDTEVVEGGAEAGAGDTSTLDSKGENSGQKRWKLKRSWTFQGLKRDPSMQGISKAAKGSDKDATDAKAEESAVAEDGEQAATTGESDQANAAEAVDGETEKADGEEDKGAAASAALGAVSQHANEIWTNFKKRVTPKSKKSVSESGEEDGAAAAAVPADGEQTEEKTEGGKEAKSAKAKRTHFNRAVSLKNFILRKGKSSSVDGAPKEGEEGAAADGEAETPAGGEADGAQAAGNDETPAANDHAAEGGEEKPTAEPAATPAPATTAEPVATPAAPPAEATPAPEVTTNGENGCTNGTAEEDAAHNHESSPKKMEEANSNAADVKMAAKVAASQGNAVAQSEKKAGNV